MNAPFTPQKSRRWSRATIAVFVTTAAALFAWVLGSVAALSERTVVLTVMVSAFAISWIVTNVSPVTNHRVTVVRARARSH